MQYWNIKRITSPLESLMFQQLLEECSIGTRPWAIYRPLARCFSSCQKNVVLEQRLRAERLLRPYGFSSCQKNVVLELHQTDQMQLVILVSVVVRRMQYWNAFPLTQSNRTLQVSVVVRRMQYWNLSSWANCLRASCFSSCQKNVVLEQQSWPMPGLVLHRFSSCQKNVVLELRAQPVENKGF